MRILNLTCLFLALAAGPAFAQSAAATQATPVTPPAAVPAGDVIDHAPVVVTGVQTGPGMWKVSKGDHVLWVLGTLSPLPKNIEWRSNEVESVLAQAQEVLDSPRFGLDAKVGFFGALMLLPSAMKASKNADGQELQQVLPADLYARWTLLKKKYIGSDRGIEHKRPILAAGELYSDALAKSGLSRSAMISSVIDAVVKRRKLTPTPTGIKIAITDPKAAIKEFGAEGINDVECFRKTLDRVENDLPAMVERANAWSVGDVDMLRQLPYDDQQVSCEAAFMQAGFAKKRGITDIDARMKAVWLGAAQAAIDKNTISFATLPIAELLKSDGYLAQLQARGYQVEAPE